MKVNCKDNLHISESRLERGWFGECLAGCTALCHLRCVDSTRVVGCVRPRAIEFIHFAEFAHLLDGDEVFTVDRFSGHATEAAPCIVDPNTLTRTANAAGRATVLKFCRSLGRLNWFYDTFLTRFISLSLLIKSHKGNRAGNCSPGTATHMLSSLRHRAEFELAGNVQIQAA
ncbi:hypothetical protein [Paraburkholderia sp. J7]|uniref:hypothetical protein n=1 Tax=Paraburkholderia sp. J7 TaxID=2805438 RepID=UPI002AB7AE1F|nr:hypothetical protein [Paraburkholderia sp. J7]